MTWRALIPVLALAACVQADPQPQGPTQGERLGVPKGEILFQREDDAEEFDGHVERFAPMSCTTLNSAIAALDARPAPSSGTRTAARVGGALIPGVAGSLTRVIGSEIAASAAQRGNIQLSAAQAVRAAKEC